jgi:hypothetical protein
VLYYETLNTAETDLSRALVNNRRFADIKGIAIEGFNDGEKLIALI